MKIQANINGQCIIVPSAPVLEKLGDADAAKLRVLLYVLAKPEFDPEEVCEKIDVTKKSLTAAIDYWVACGAITVSGEKSPAKTTKSAEKSKVSENVSIHRPKALARASELPKYTSDEITDFVNTHNEVQELLVSCQQYMGKIFNMAEIETVIGLLDYLKLDSAYILLLFSHCEKMGKKSLRYVEKLALGLFDNGIMDYDELDEHLKAIEEAAQLDKPLRNLFGIGRRTLTKKEKDFFQKWCMWQMPFPLIEKAYEITVENTGGASVPYCNAVLEKWYQSGYTTTEQVETALQEYRHDKEGEKDKKGSFETDDFFEAALKRSYAKKN